MKTGQYVMTDEDTAAFNLLEHSCKEFLERYVYIPIIQETQIDYNEDGYGLIPVDYLSLYRFDWSKKKIVRYDIGDDRKKHLYVDLCIMRLINPAATFVELLYNIIRRRCIYYVNTDSKLTNQYVRDLVIASLSHDISDFKFIHPSTHGRFKVDKVFCLLHGVKAKQYARKVQKHLNQQDISQWYNVDKSLSENLQFAKDNGIKVSRSALRTFCLDNSINMDPHAIPPEDWYDIEMSLKDNL